MPGGLHRICCCPDLVPDPPGTQPDCTRTPTSIAITFTGFNPGEHCDSECFTNPLTAHCHGSYRRYICCSEVVVLNGTYEGGIQTDFEEAGKPGRLYVIDPDNIAMNWTQNSSRNSLDTSCTTSSRRGDLQIYVWIIANDAAACAVRGVMVRAGRTCVGAFAYIDEQPTTNYTGQALPNLGCGFHESTIVDTLGNLSTRQQLSVVSATSSGSASLQIPTASIPPPPEPTPSAGPVNQYVFDDSTSAVQCLSMSDSDWSWPNEPDLSEFGILARVNLAENLTSGERWIWSDYQAFMITSWYFGRIHSNGRMICRTSSNTGGTGLVYTDSSFVASLVGVETLIYLYYGPDGVLRLYAGQDDDALTELATDTSTGEPRAGSGQVVFGAKTATAFGWYGTIHQPCFFTANAGVSVPTATEVGTAATPIDLRDHGALFSQPDADFPLYPNMDSVHPQAWTNNSSLTVEPRET